MNSSQIQDIFNAAIAKAKEANEEWKKKCESLERASVTSYHDKRMAEEHCKRAETEYLKVLHQNTLLVSIMAEKVITSHLLIVVGRRNHQVGETDYVPRGTYRCIGALV